MIIFHFTLVFLKNPILKVGLNRIFKNVYTCTKCPVSQNGLHVDEIFFNFKFQFSGALKYISVLSNYGCYNHNISSY
jgi:hypothetical protein